MVRISKILNAHLIFLPGVHSKLSVSRGLHLWSLAVLTISAVLRARSEKSAGSEQDLHPLPQHPHQNRNQEIMAPSDFPSI